MNFPVLCSNIPTASAHGWYIFQLIRYSGACGSYYDLLDRRLLLTRMLLNQVFLVVKLKSSLRMFYGRHHDLVNCYGMSVSQTTTISSVCRNLNPVLSSFLTYHRVCNRSNTTDATCMTGEVVGDTKGVIKIRISKNRQHNGQKNKRRSTKHTYKTKDRETRILLKTEGELRCSGRVRSSCSTSDISRVNLVTNPVINRE